VGSIHLGQGHARGKGETGALTALLLSCGELAGPLFVAIFLVEGVRRRSYLARRHPVSALALGESGWIQTANFLATGALTCAFAVGAQRALRLGPGSTWIPRLVATIGCGLLGAGAFVADPISGYPPGTPDLPAEHTKAGMLHNLCALPAFLGAPAACFAYSRRCAADREWRWATYFAAAGAVFTSAFVLSGTGFNQSKTLVDNAGLFQRVAIISGFGSMSIFAARLRCQTTKAVPT
jgi:hypothetical protein